MTSFLDQTVAGTEFDHPKNIQVYNVKEKRHDIHVLCLQGITNCGCKIQRGVGIVIENMVVLLLIIA